MLNKFSFRSIKFAHLSLAFVGLMWVLPFLDFRHLHPITTFYQEWEAAILGLCALSLFQTRQYWQQLEIPRVVLLPLGLLAILFVQYFLDLAQNLDQAILLALYLSGAALLVMLGHRLRVELGLPLLALVLASFLALGAELNALAGILQHFMWHTFLDPVVSIKLSSSVVGNLAQPNHFANYITLGLASIGLLHTRWSLRAWQTALLVTPLLFVLVLSGSRGAWLYLLFMAGMSYLWQRRDKTFLPLMKYALWLLLGFILMQFVVQIPWLAGTRGVITAFERTFGNGGGIGIRLYLWQEAWLIFTHFPLLGAGFGQFAWQHFQLGAELHDPHISSLYNHAHNLVMEVAAETGLVGLSVLFSTLGLWLWQAWNEPRTLYHWWGYVVLAVLGIHSLLEYPLWYLHYIGIAAVTLGMMESTVYRIGSVNQKLCNLGRLAVVAIILFAASLLAQEYQGYKKLEVALAKRPLSNNEGNFKANLRSELLDTFNQHDALLRLYAELFLACEIVPDTQHLADKLALNETALHFLPIAPVAYREIWLLALSDRLPEAKIQLQQTLWSFPSEFPAAQAEMKQTALSDPAHFAALSEFASQQYDEYQRAVHAK